jgi:phage/plasmid-associated DNA primase
VYAKIVVLLICNNIPECDNMDNAFSKRLRCINFPTEFVEHRGDVRSIVQEWKKIDDAE